LRCHETEIVATLPTTWLTKSDPEIRANTFLEGKLETGWTLSILRMINFEKIIMCARVQIHHKSLLVIIEPK